jgi:hypothetical protein
MTTNTADVLAEVVHEECIAAWDRLPPDVAITMHSVDAHSETAQRRVAALAACHISLVDNRELERLRAVEAAAAGLRRAAIKAGAHIVVTNDYPDGVKAFGILCDAIDVMDAALTAKPSPSEGEGP